MHTGPVLRAMAELTTTDMALGDKIFGMYGWYALDFSNDRFVAFFNRHALLCRSSPAHGRPSNTRDRIHSIQLPSIRR
ncbi:hypothetical protein EMEDMD4_910048 [Sinorhizobium medicae]|uniref:Uncharacterized protein n=1 Tax=Sinorhizobium medicae TaxID=110321 RepID=A0A508X8C7_9HYPH|nr:hypothetical protein EMEDMD4_910048 [Sinorhizobium medicae]